MHKDVPEIAYQLKEDGCFYDEDKQDCCMKKLDRDIVRQVFESCTWGNSTDDSDVWFDLLQGTDENAKKILFGKLFRELSDASPLRSLFDEEQIRTFLRDFRKPFRLSFQERRRKVWRFLFLGEREPIPGLDWIITK